MHAQRPLTRFPPDVVEQLASAIRQFVETGNATPFSQAVAVYVQAARIEAQPIEQVLAALNTAIVHIPPYPQGSERDPARLRELLLRGVLIVYYGDAAVAAQDAARSRRHTGSHPVVPFPEA